MTSSGAAAAVFDVDGTLCDTRSTAALALLWSRRRQDAPWRHLMWLTGLAWRVPRLWASDRMSRDAADRQVYRQFAGLSAARVADEARQCCEDVLLPLCFPEAMREMRAHRAAGRRLVLVSGGVDVVLAPFAEALGAELLAQHLAVSNGRFTGEYRTYAVLGDEMPASGHAARKAAALVRYAEHTGIDLSATVGYGDSVNDIPMLERIGTPVAVRPGRRLAIVARERGWKIERWSGTP